MKTTETKGSHSTTQKSGCSSSMTGCSTDKNKAKAGATKSTTKAEHKKVGK